MSFRNKRRTIDILKDLFKFVAKALKGPISGELVKIS